MDRDNFELAPVREADVGAVDAEAADVVYEEELVGRVDGGDGVYADDVFGEVEGLGTVYGEEGVIVVAEGAGAGVCEGSFADGSRRMLGVRAGMRVGGVLGSGMGMSG